MSGLLQDISRKLNIPEFSLRLAISNAITWVETPLYYFCPVLNKLKRTIMNFKHKGIWQDLIVLQRTLLSHITFILVERGSVAKISWMPGSELVLFIKRKGSELPVLRVQNSEQFNDKLLINLSPGFRPCLQFFSPSHGVNKIRVQNGLMGYGGCCRVETLTSYFIFNKFPVQHFEVDDIDSVGEILSKLTNLSDCACCFVVSDETMKISYRFGDVRNVVYWLLFHTESRLWYVVGCEQKGIAYYSSLHQPLGRQLNWEKISKFPNNIIYESYSTNAEGEYTRTNKLGCKMPNSAIMLDHSAGHIEYVGDITKEVEIIQKHMLGEFFITQANMSIDKFWSTRQRNIPLVKTDIVYPIEKDDRYIICNFDGKGHMVNRTADYEIFHDWRMLYANPDVGFIPDSDNIYASVLICDPYDIKLDEEVTFNKRWSPNFYSNIDSEVNVDIMEDIDGIYLVALRKIKEGELFVCIPRDPLFIEPNDFLDKMDRFEVVASPYLQQLGSDTCLGLFAKRTLLQGYEYAQLYYCAKHLSQAEVEKSDSAYIWKCLDGTGMDGKSCPECYAKRINSADFVKGGKYINTGMCNVDMLIDTMYYVPSRNIIKGEELLTLYGKNYWV